MSDRPAVAEDSVTVHVPMTFRRHGGRKRIVAPDEVEPEVRAKQPDATLVKALARAFRWRKLLESGVHSTVEDIARSEKISASYVSRILRLTLLAPDIVEAILDGKQPAELQLGTLPEPLSNRWEEQRARINLIS